MDKETLRKKVIQGINDSDKCQCNAYSEEIKMRKTQFRHKKAHAEALKRTKHRNAMRRYRKAHPNYDRDYYRTHKKNCEHIGKIVFNEAQSTSLVCVKCGSLIAKVNF
jgi:hypothetical protein